MTKYGLLAFFVAVILLPNTPIYNPVPSRDSGVFLYIGDQIIQGKVPYRDVWDHKGPLIYYINALAWFVGRGSLWGIWCVEFLSLFLASLLGYVLIQDAFGEIAAIFSLIVWWLALYCIQSGGNYTEEFTLPFQFAALYLYWRTQATSRHFWYDFGIGVMLALSMLLRPNNIGIYLAIIVVIGISAIMQRAWRVGISRFWAIFLGIAAVLSVVLYSLVRNRTLASFYDQVLRYNVVYVDATLERRALAAIVGLTMLLPLGSTIIVLMSWMSGLLYTKNLDIKFSAQRALIYVMLIGLPIEVILVALSGRVYPHYYLTLLPFYMVLVGHLIFRIMTDNVLRVPRWALYLMLTAIVSMTNYRSLKDIGIKLTFSAVCSDSDRIIADEIITEGGGQSDYRPRRDPRGVCVEKLPPPRTDPNARFPAADSGVAASG